RGTRRRRPDPRSPEKQRGSGRNPSLPPRTRTYQLDLSLERLQPRATGLRDPAGVLARLLAEQLRQAGVVPGQAARVHPRVLVVCALHSGRSAGGCLISASTRSRCLVSTGRTLRVPGDEAAAGEATDASC